MSLKQTILKDFTTAFKAKQEVRKATLSGLKAEITKVEKLNGSTDLDDASVLKVLLASIKARKQSIEGFEKGNRLDLVANETAELHVLEEYLPKGMSEEEAKGKIDILAAALSGETNRNKKVGMIMGAFNKQYQGQFDNGELKKLIESIVP